MKLPIRSVRRPTLRSGKWGNPKRPPAPGEGQGDVFSDGSSILPAATTPPRTAYRSRRLFLFQSKRRISFAPLLVPRLGKPSAPQAGGARGGVPTGLVGNIPTLVCGSTPRPPAPRVRGQTVRCTDGGVPTPAGVGKDRLLRRRGGAPRGTKFPRAPIPPPFSFS